MACISSWYSDPRLFLDSGEQHFGGERAYHGIFRVMKSPDEGGQRERSDYVREGQDLVRAGWESLITQGSSKVGYIFSYNVNKKWVRKRQIVTERRKGRKEGEKRRDAGDVYMYV